MARALTGRGAGRLTGAAEWFWYIAAAIGYIAFGIWHRWLLNWFVGPLWLVAVVSVGPALVDLVLGLFTGRRR
jgi:cyanate permease